MLLPVLEGRAVCAYPPLRFHHLCRFKAEQLATANQGSAASLRFLNYSLGLTAASKRYAKQKKAPP